jgi:hypothetical protein
LYYDSDLFEFIRSPLETNHEKLREITYFNKNTDPNGSVSGIEINGNSLRFGYKLQDIEAVGKIVLY